MSDVTIEMVAPCIIVDLLANESAQEFVNSIKLNLVNNKKRKLFHFYSHLN